ncbi:hypothetical protein H1S01_04115 [Heliobacterium chlorum]|uniref:Protein kinase domain-containing protein n=1 Tax=Heliobacterium chlorum TaxID=2698 RepID=A0ABR7T2C6_HELCL|nr:hypothetical protein [Heliobacterium chlorum]MBC9783696.1 hypothetical protein [Heliobacterium chlorum]
MAYVVRGKAKMEMFNMPFPQGREYLESVEDLRNAFEDRELRTCFVERTPLGRPRLYSGGNTTTFHFYRPQAGWAVRCYLQEIPSLDHRYQVIRMLMKEKPCNLFVPSEWVKKGIRVGDQWYPIVKMPWIDGDLLHDYIEKNLSQRVVLQQLPKAFLQLILQLNKLGAAHGDLQHGNIIVHDGKLHLIGYDGMYISDLSSLGPLNLGHPNYQHPLRSDAHYDESIDNFSSIVIYLAMAATALSPVLWTQFADGENILFRQEDFHRPEQSELLARMKELPQVAHLVDRFKLICRLPYEKIPRLVDFLSRNYVPPSLQNVSLPSPALRSPYPLVETTDPERLLSHVGQRIAVSGRISRIHRGFRRPEIFFHFGLPPRETFSVMVWSEQIDTLRRNALVEHFSGKKVRVTGVLTIHEGKPVMILDSLTSLQVLKEPMSIPANRNQPSFTPPPSPVNTGEKTAAPTQAIAQPLAEDPQKKSNVTEVPSLVPSPVKTESKDDPDDELTSMETSRPENITEELCQDLALSGLLKNALANADRDQSVPPLTLESFPSAAVETNDKEGIPEEANREPDRMNEVGSEANPPDTTKNRSTAPVIEKRIPLTPSSGIPFGAEPVLPKKKGQRKASVRTGTPSSHCPTHIPYGTSPSATPSNLSLIKTVFRYFFD